jgi:hypothetical protein
MTRRQAAAFLACGPIGWPATLRQLGLQGRLVADCLGLLAAERDGLDLDQLA